MAYFGIESHPEQTKLNPFHICKEPNFQWMLWRPFHSKNPPFSVCSAISVSVHPRELWHVRDSPETKIPFCMHT